MDLGTVTSQLVQIVFFGGLSNPISTGVPQNIHSLYECADSIFILDILQLTQLQLTQLMSISFFTVYCLSSHMLTTRCGRDSI